MQRIDVAVTLATVLVVIITGVAVMDVYTDPTHLCQTEYGDNWKAEDPNVQNLSEFACVNERTGNRTQFEWPTNLSGETVHTALFDHTTLKWS